jgi:uncharacterized membrane protein YeaQ/YmgE (transglycosylase-associated protein family)
MNLNFGFRCAVIFQPVNNFCSSVAPSQPMKENKKDPHRLKAVLRALRPQQHLTFREDCSRSVPAHFSQFDWRQHMVSGLVWWILVGLIAGWLAGKVMKGGGFGVLMDIVIGMIGGVIGGWLFGALGIFPGGGIIGSILVAFCGAVILLWLVRLIKRA